MTEPQLAWAYLSRVAEAPCAELAALVGLGPRGGMSTVPIDLVVEGKGVPLAHLTACQVVEVAQQP
jgi:hypothetical protein